MNTYPIKVLFVCLGNICRSPTAQAIFSHKVREKQLEDTIITDSAGILDLQTAGRADPRAIKSAASRNYDLSALRARQIQTEDFSDFQYVLAMDSSNFQYLQRMKPASSAAKISLMLQFYTGVSWIKEVPDPYHAGENSFDVVLNLLENSCDNLLTQIIKEHSLKVKTL